MPPRIVSRRLSSEFRTTVRAIGTRCGAVVRQLDRAHNYGADSEEHTPFFTRPLVRYQYGAHCATRGSPRLIYTELLMRPKRGLWDRLSLRPIYCGCSKTTRVTASGYIVINYRQASEPWRKRRGGCTGRTSDGFLVIRWSEPGIIVQARGALYNRHGENRPALAASVGAIPVCGPLCDYPRTGV